MQYCISGPAFVWTMFALSILEVMWFLSGFYPRDCRDEPSEVRVKPHLPLRWWLAHLNWFCRAVLPHSPDHQPQGSPPEKKDQLASCAKNLQEMIPISFRGEWEEVWSSRDSDPSFTRPHTRFRWEQSSSNLHWRVSRARCHPQFRIFLKFGFNWKIHRISQVSQVPKDLQHWTTW